MPAKALSAAEIGLPRFDPGDAQSGEVFALSSHRRAREALEFGLSVPDPGFNVFVLGERRSGRMTATLGFLGDYVADKPPPDDWIYLNNFRRPHRPKPYRLRAGEGRRLRARLARLVTELREALSATFEGEAFQERLRRSGETLRESLAREIEAVRADARTRGLDVIESANGPAIVAVDDDGSPLSGDQIAPERRAETEAAAREIEQRLREVNREAARRRTAVVEEVQGFQRDAAGRAIAAPFAAVEAAFDGHRGLTRWFAEMRRDVVENLELFREPAKGETPPTGGPPERRYAVNLFVDHSDDLHPGVIVEANPTYQNLFGRIEYRQVGGALDTDFTLIRSGALHRANGGCLVLRAEDLTATPAIWGFLKSALRDREVRIEEVGRGGPPIAGAPRPKPIRLDVKLILIGGPEHYYTFFSLDPDFESHVKVKADIDADMEADTDNLARYAGLIRGLVRDRLGVACDDEAVAHLLGMTARWAGDRGKLSSRFELLEDVLTEAAQGDGGARPDRITEQAVKTAIANRRRRNARVEDRMQEAIARGRVMIATTGAAVGQVNALTIRDLGDHAFGAPSRVTARASPGRRGVINIERDADLGGPIQQKGVMVLQGFLAGHFARRFPLSFNCSVTFEQTYGGVEGDSASLAELLAILSDLAGAPLRQDLAITGSVNQRGEAQAIGGAHHKVEGFFRTCDDRGLTGDQGVAVPAANESDLVLRDDVAAAVAKGRFHVYSVTGVDDAVTLFTGIEAGVADDDGRYPPETVYGRVATRLEAFDRILAAREGGMLQS
ncbi:MAG: Lon protease family protein [Alphaproteobacteria bacterium]